MINKDIYSLRTFLLYLYLQVIIFLKAMIKILLGSKKKKKNSFTFIRILYVLLGFILEYQTNLLSTPIPLVHMGSHNLCTMVVVSSHFDPLLRMPREYLDDVEQIIEP